MSASVYRQSQSWVTLEGEEQIIAKSELATLRLQVGQQSASLLDRQKEGDLLQSALSRVEAFVQKHQSENKLLQEEVLQCCNTLKELTRAEEEARHSCENLSLSLAFLCLEKLLAEMSRWRATIEQHESTKTMQHLIVLSQVE